MDKRLEFKDSVAAKIAAKLAQQPEKAPAITPLPVKVPLNFHSLPDTELYGILTTSQNITPDQGSDLVEHLRGRYSTGVYTVILTGAYSPTPEKTPTTEKIESEPEPRKVSVTLPWNFELLSTSGKFLWLTKEASLPFDEANDIIDMLDNRPTYSGTVFELSFDTPPAIEQKREPVRVEAPKQQQQPVLKDENRIEVSIPIGLDFRSLSSGEQYWFLVTEFGLSYDEANEIVGIYRNLLQPSDRIHREGGSQFVVYRNNEEKTEPTRRGDDIPTGIRLPHEFRLLTPSQQFAFLQVERMLSPDRAHEVLALLDGKGTADLGLKYRIEFAEPAPVGENPIPEYVTRNSNVAANIRKQAEKSVRAPKAKPEFVAPTPAPLPVVDITLPFEFKALTPGLQHSYLQSAKKLLPQEASDVLAALEGKEAHSIQFNVSFSAPVSHQDNPVEAYLREKAEAAAAREAKRAARQPKTKPTPSTYTQPTKGVEVPVFSVTLPNWFSDARPVDQFVYLTRTRLMVPEDASDLIAHLSGFKTSKVFEVEYEGN